MNHQEINRVGLVKMVEAKKLSQKNAATQLNICARQMRRLQLRYREEGVKGLMSKRKGKRSNNCFSHNFKTEISNLIKEKYAGFGPTLVHEKVTELHDKKISEESVRKIMIELGLWQPKVIEINKEQQLYFRVY